MDPNRKNAAGKKCAVCGLDVARVPHVQDQQGRYYCRSCQAYRAHEQAHPPAVAYQPPPVVRITAQQQSAAARASKAKTAAPPLPLADDDAPPDAPEAPPASAPRAAPAAEDTVYDLEDEPKLPAARPAPPPATRASGPAPVAAPPPVKPPPVPAEEALLGCAGCRGIFPQAEVISHEGEFFCAACAEERDIQPPEPPASLLTANKRKLRGPDPIDWPALAAAWKRVGLWSLGLAGGAFVLLLLVIFGLHLDPINLFYATRQRLPLGEGLAAAAALAVLTMVQSVILLGSMAVSARLFGGLDFGNLETAMTKAVVVVLLGNTLGFLVPGIFWGVLFILIRPGIFLLGLMVLFRLEKVEAFAISCANSIFTWVLLLVLGIVLWSVFGKTISRDVASAHHHGTTTADMLYLKKIEQGLKK